MKKIASVLVLVLCTFVLHAQSMPAEALPSGTDALVLGGLEAGRRGFGVWENMSASAFNDKDIVVGASFMSWAPASSSVSSSNLGVDFKLGKLSLAVQGRYNAGKSYPLYNSDWQQEGVFSPYDAHAGFGAAYPVLKNLAAGIAVKYSNSSIAEGFSASCVSTDLSVCWNPGRVSVSAAACNFGTKVRYSAEGAESDLPRLLKAGASYRPLEQLTLSVEADWMLNNSSLMLTMGGKLRLFDFFILKTGFHYGAKGALIPSYFSAGCGFELGPFVLDALFVGGSETLGNSVCAGLSLGF